MNQDKIVVRTVITFVGLIALILAGGMLLLNLNGQHIDPVLTGVAAGALGALTAMLAHTGNNSDSTPVTVANTDPIPVIEGKHDLAEVVGADLPTTDLGA